MPLNSAKSLGRVASPARVLQLLIEQGVTGRLRVNHLQGSLPGWSVDVAQGKIQFAGGEDPKGDRLTYLLQRSARQLLPLVKKYPRARRTPYAFLHCCWQRDCISLQELRQLLRISSQEALVHLLALPQGRVQFERGVTPEPILISLDFDRDMEPLEEKIVQWQFLGERQIFPHRCLSLLRGERFSEQFRGPLTAQSRARPLPDPQAMLAQEPSLYHLAAQFNGDLLAIAKLMDQAVKLGYLRWLGMGTQIAGGAGKQGTIACLDSSVATQQEVRQSLEAVGYRVIGLSYPQQALSILMKERPSLILMDASLATSDDQGLMRSLRQSSLLKHIPLLLFSSHDSLINPVRAKAIGAVGWLVKPLEAEALLAAVERWAIPQSNSKSA